MPPPISTLTTRYASAPPLTILPLLKSPQDMPLTLPSTPLMPNPLLRLPSLCSGIRSIGYSGLLAYMMNTITEICLVACSANTFWGEIGGDVHNVVIRV
ncbi:hypothetical protein O181_062651 [Austropuccinia psidii MF-1]|uniref:Uncharacterized protein n=1 Tax=Austropuccinia psidii MF-1 TaxID=1389203 RepID=A0A9Q3EQ66_9BASI|nr:hypothetical protein [Austropuccinia psidii MF-1]